MHYSYNLSSLVDITVTWLPLKQRTEKLILSPWKWAESPQSQFSIHGSNSVLHLAFLYWKMPLWPSWCCKGLSWAASRRSSQEVRKWYGERFWGQLWRKTKHREEIVVAHYRGNWHLQTHLFPESSVGNGVQRLFVIGKLWQSQNTTLNTQHSILLPWFQALALNSIFSDINKYIRCCYFTKTSSLSFFSSAHIFTVTFQIYYYPFLPPTHQSSSYHHSRILVIP